MRQARPIQLYGDRAWALPAIFAVFGTAAAIGGAIVLAGELRGVNVHGPAMAGGVIAILLGGVIGYLGLAALREGGTYVVIDPSAGTLEHHAGKKIETCQLSELGGLVIVKCEPTRVDGRRSVPTWQLRAERVAKPLFESLNRDKVVARKARIDQLVRDYDSRIASSQQLPP